MTRAILAAVVCGLAACPFIAAEVTASGNGALVWRIGSFDRSSGEFSSRRAAGEVIFVAGQSSPKVDWPAFQSSGEADPDIRTVQFSGRPTQAAFYRLRVAILIEHPGVPALRIGINGHKGVFYFSPELDYNMGDPAGGGHAGYSHADLEVDLPAADFRTGTNAITFEALNRGEAVPEAGLFYDALELTAGSGTFDSDAVSGQVVPTVFYQLRAGRLCELIEVIVRRSGRLKAGEVKLEVGGASFRAPLAAENEFGEERFEFAVPEFPRETEARLELSIDGRKSQVRNQLVPARKWTVYVVPHNHLDIGFTDYQAKVAVVQARIVDEALDLIAQHPEFRYSLDGEWCLDQFMAGRGPEDRQRAIEAVRNRRLFVPAQSEILLTGSSTAEALIRSLYPSANFSRMHGTPFDYANITDVPSFSWSYASVLASAGIRYLAAGSNNHRAPILIKGRLNENSPFWWEGPDGRKVLLWYAFVYRQAQMLFGLPQQVHAGEQMLPIFLQSYDRPGYRAQATLLYGTQGENRDLYPQQAEFVGKWNARYAYPHLQYSGFAEALAEIARQFGDAIPTMRGDGGAYWEDGIASDALATAVERSAEARATSAEKLATIGSLVNPRIGPNRPALDELWQEIALADEHTFGGSDSVSDPASAKAEDVLAVKDSFAVQAHRKALDILRTAMGNVVDSIAAPPGSVVVFNPLNWTRDGLVVVDLRSSEQLVESGGGRVVPLRLVSSGRIFRRVEFLARSVPAVGYRVYSVRHGAEPKGDAPAEAASAVLENAYYRIELDPAKGAVRSLYDKQLGKELVDLTGPYRFGQYVYVSGGDETPNSIINFGAVSPRPKLTVSGAEGGRVVSIGPTPWGWSAILESAAPNTPGIRTEIRLFDREKKIEFIAGVDKLETRRKEAVYFAFPFALDQPRFRYENQTGWVDPARDMLPGAGMEWFSAQHWVSVDQGGVAAVVMPLDAPLVTLGDINRGAWPDEFGVRRGNIFSYVMNNYWPDNYRAAQGGHFLFRYVVTSGSAEDPIALSRRGWEEMTPLEASQVQSQDVSWPRPHVLDGKQGSFLQVEDPALLLETWKPAEDGRGTVLRLLELGGAVRSVMIQAPLLDLKAVWRADAVENDQMQLSLTGRHEFAVPVLPHEIITLRLIGASVLAPPQIH